MASLLSSWHDGLFPSFGLASLCHLGDATTYTAIRHELEWSFNIHTENQANEACVGPVKGHLWI